MKGEKFNIPGNRLRVLVAPLDWGLGHATRCIPVIFKLLELNCDVIIAAEGAGKILLQKEFPDLLFIDLKGYRVSYSHNKFWMPVKLLLQFPKLMFRIYAENRWLHKTVENHKIDAVISDNRLGLYHKKIPCIYMTHQLLIKTGNHFTERIAQKIHYHYINKYKACWVPDAGGEINLAGELSHPVKLPKTPLQYLGPLSRFEKMDVEFKYDLCIILSGPEPQRTAFEKIILNGLNNFSGKAILVRGLPEKNVILDHNNAALEIKNHLPSAELNIILQQSKMIISRCGYSTVMDLVVLQKKAILIPTPGQTEQEYLAAYLLQKKLFYTEEQNCFVLVDVLKKAEEFHYAQSALTQNDHKTIIEDFVKTLTTINNTNI